MDANHFNQATQAAPVPSTPRAPTLWHALGLIALYFVQQLAVYSLLVIAAGLFDLAAHGGALIDVLSRGHDWIVRSDASAIVVMVTLLISASLILYLARRYWPALWSLPQPPGLGFCTPRPLILLALALVLGAMMPLVGGWLTQWLARGHAVSQDIKQLGAHTPLSLRMPLALLVVTLGPLVEELLFRGVLLSAVARYVGSGWSVLITAALFAVVHLPDLAFLWYALPNLAVLGLLLGWLRVQSGSIWPAVLAHGMNNLLAVVSWFVLMPGG
ncbi:CPBP family intramembrane glutamic endopeptidase [Dyella sp. ASV21]|jgi:membrane protease YdiL (CAAX protease family)|uniref:CPBP family intramembrane glutamic endopeptidase n=1 Tax=Dyella sp. ASV21 TaxID=2795114 RepID=UPI0018EC8776|nr:CPBP family intramembrane glutamic endopeptidase [Dyella sp. ASV21]